MLPHMILDCSKPKNKITHRRKIWLLDTLHVGPLLALTETLHTRVGLVERLLAQNNLQRKESNNT